MPLFANMFHRNNSLSVSLSKRCTCFFVSLLFLLFFPLRTHAQTTINLPHYTKGELHFGFIIAANFADFVITPSTKLGAAGDTLKTIRSVPQAGFDLGIVAEGKISQYLKIRFVPSLGFSERQLVYSFEGVDTFQVTKLVQSVFLNFPLDLKLISKRQKNFEAYVLGGGHYATDLASQNNVVESLEGPQATVRLYRNDWYYEAGGGIEFYLPYFKFGLELKISQGLRNLIIPDNTIYTQSISALRSKIYLFSLTFEG